MHVSGVVRRQEASQASQASEAAQAASAAKGQAAAQTQSEEAQGKGERGAARRQAEGRAHRMYAAPRDPSACL